MNTAILSKCIEELKNEKPDLSYVRGMLETLVEMTIVKVPEMVVGSGSGGGAIYMPPVVPPMDEASILDAKAKVALATIKLTEQIE